MVDVLHFANFLFVVRQKAHYESILCMKAIAMGLINNNLITMFNQLISERLGMEAAV